MRLHAMLAWALGNCMRLQVVLTKRLVGLTATTMSRQQVGIRRLVCLL
jgi:hypothetical protein